jgi:glycosyltransferase involved in cell wall biosynthesis
VIILPSLYEGTPNVVLEALICKKPVIISIAANKSKLILEGINGLIFETNNYYQLADCILKMKNNSIKLNNSYMESFFELYDNKRVVDDYVDCFESI